MIHIIIYIYVYTWLVKVFTILCCHSWAGAPFALALAGHQSLKHKNGKHLVGTWATTQRPFAKFEVVKLAPSHELQPKPSGSPEKWLGVKKKSTRDHRFWSIFPFTKRLFWVALLVPQPDEANKGSFVVGRSGRKSRLSLEQEAGSYRALWRKRPPGQKNFPRWAFWRNIYLTKSVLTCWRRPQKQSSQYGLAA